MIPRAAKRTGLGAAQALGSRCSTAFWAVARNPDRAKPIGGVVRDLSNQQGPLYEAPDLEIGFIAVAQYSCTQASTDNRAGGSIKVVQTLMRAPAPCAAAGNWG
jgi:hypothetical protein